MLSRVAQNMYWTARYIERAENTARLINVNHLMALDLPSKVRPGWEPLLTITASKGLFGEHFTAPTQANVVKFMAAEESNPSSIVSSLHHARENARTMRDFFARDAWEQLNSLYRRLHQRLAIRRRSRARPILAYDDLQDVIHGCQLITGLLAGTMLQDEGYDFLRLGRNIERADMTTRILDIASVSTLPLDAAEFAPFRMVRLRSILQSLSGYQMYRRAVSQSLRRALVSEFLLRDERFPRAYAHCIAVVHDCLQNLPRHKELLDEVSGIQDFLGAVDLANQDLQRLHELMDQLQVRLDRLHGDIKATYFSVAAD